MSIGNFHGEFPNKHTPNHSRRPPRDQINMFVRRHSQILGNLGHRGCRGVKYQRASRVIRSNGPVPTFSVRFYVTVFDIYSDGSLGVTQWILCYKFKLCLPIIARTELHRGRIPRKQKTSELLSCYSQHLSVVVR